MEDLPDQCDYCELSVGEDEELKPLRIGGVATVQPFHLKEMGEPDRAAGVSNDKNWVCALMLLEALNDHPDVEVETHDAVMTFEPTMLEQRTSNELHEPTLDHDKYGVELSIFPEVEQPEPDAMVCEDCADQFRLMGE